MRSSQKSLSEDSQESISGVSLSRFNQALRDYQEDVVSDALQFYSTVRRQDNNETYAVGAGRRRLYAAPTGVGKGTMELALLKRISHLDAWILTPSLEVIRGFLQRCGATEDDLLCGSERLASLGESIRVTTPQRFLNRMLTGHYRAPEVVIWDEAHHAIDDTQAGTLFACAPDAVWLGFTATPYRGTPKGTRALREAWGEPTLVMTVPEAVAGGYWSLPTFEIVPLLDDDKVVVRSGKFVAKSLNARGKNHISDTAELIRNLIHPTPCVHKKCLSPGTYHDCEPPPRKPMVVVMPSLQLAGALVEELDSRQISARQVVGTTPAKERQRAYRECEQCQTVLVVVAVLSEGVDFPWLGRLIDCSPTLSPVAWMQRLGRLTRPKDYRPEYITTCRNLERQRLSPRRSRPCLQDR